MGEDEELAELVALAREHVLFEQDLGSRGLPDLIEEVRRRGAAAPEPPARAAESAPADAAPRPSAPSAAPASGDRRARLALVEAEVSTCTKCRLHAGRTNTVFARGNPDARLVFVGEGPGFNED